MHFTHRLAAIFLTLGLSASLMSCGFHLRGSHIVTLPEQYQSLHLEIPDEAQALKKPLTVYLSNLGAQLDNTPTNVTLRIDHYDLRRQLFSGRLTEVQLRLSVSFRLENAAGEPLTEPRTVIAQRSYQYNIANVNTERQEEAFLVQVMQDDIAQQIVRQLHANRLPDAIIDQAP